MTAGFITTHTASTITMEHKSYTLFFLILLFAPQIFGQSATVQIIEQYDEDGDELFNLDEFTDYFIETFGGEHGMDPSHIHMEIEEDDHDHGHKIVFYNLLKQTTNFTDVCPLPDQIFQVFNVDVDSFLNETEFESAMPQILYMLMEGCVIHEEEEEPCPELQESLQWVSALLASIVVSLVSLVGIVLIPTNKKNIQKFITGPLVAFGVGALLGDAVLHLIPHSLAVDDSLGPPFMVLIGMFVFYVVEKYVHHFHGFLHHHHHADKSSVFHNPSSDENNMNVEEDQPGKIKPVGYLSLVADAVHNLTDGIAIGAAFGGSFTAGLATTIAVIIHEVPQEFGDFAILIESGFSKKKALLFNFLSAVSCVLGSIIGLAAGSREEADAYILTLVAGGFIYISLAGMVPEIKKSTGMKNDFMQFGAILLGFFLMFVLAYWIEEALEVCGGHDHEH